MGKRGPRPKPTSLKILLGNPGRRRLNANEPKPSGLLPECPDHLSDKAKETWAAFSKELEDAGIATNVDAIALELLCASYANYLDAADKVSKLGAVWIEKGDGKIPKFAYSPYWAVMNREWSKVVQLLREFGLTPSSRSGLHAEKKEDSGGVISRKRG